MARCKRTGGTGYGDEKEWKERAGEDMSHGPCGCRNRMGSRLYDKTAEPSLRRFPGEQQVRMAGEELAALLWHQAAPYEMTGKNSRNITEQDGSNTDQAVKIAWEDADPVFRNHMQARLFYREHQYLDRYGDETTGEKQHEEKKGLAGEHGSRLRRKAPQKASGKR